MVVWLVLPTMDISIIGEREKKELWRLPTITPPVLEATNMLSMGNNLSEQQVNNNNKAKTK